MYSINICKNDYSEVQLISIVTGETIDFSNPTEFKGFFDGDKVTFDDNGKLILQKRHLSIIPGVIDLMSKYILKPNKRGIPGYLFNPINQKFPKFIVYTNLKKKCKCNQLITIKFIEWNDCFPRGQLIRVLGDYNSINGMELALLYHYDIYPNKIKFKNVSLKLPLDGRIKINKDIFSIDPIGCKDIDDAFSIEICNDILKLDIHIADVYHFLKTNNLLEQVKNTTSIYLTERILHMLDSQVSCNYSSLLENTTKCMLTLSIEFSYKKSGEITYKLYPSFGKITKNYSYDNYPKFIDKYFSLISNLYYCVTNNKIKIEDSHKFIEALMIIYNRKFTDYLLSNNYSVIYRSQAVNSSRKLPAKSNNELDKFLNILYSNSAKYTIEQSFHQSLNMHNYTHSTSPIRRIVDLINQELFYNGKSILLEKFKLEDVNKNQKIIKKFYRKTNKLKLAKILYDSGCQIIDCYVYSYDENKNKIDVYFPNYNLNIRYRLISKKIEGFYNIKYTKDCIVIQKLDSVTTEITIPMNKTIKVKLLGNPDIFDIENSLKIEF